MGRQWDTRRHGLLWNWPWRLIPGFKSGLKSGCPGGHDDTRACLPPPPSIPCSTNEHGPLPWLHDRTRGDKSHQPQPRELTGPGGEAALSTHVRMRELQHICSSFQELVLSFHHVGPGDRLQGIRHGSRCLTHRATLPAPPSPSVGRLQRTAAGATFSALKGVTGRGENRHYLESFWLPSFVVTP